MYKLFVSKKVDKFINKLSNYEDIKEKILLLKHFKTLRKLDLDIKKLQGQKKNQEVYRLRVGDIRIIFEIFDSKKLIWVKSANYRGSAYT